jgi:hypothetical protein
MWISLFTGKVVRDWLGRVGVKTLFIEPGSPWENGYVESFNGKLRDELLNGEIFYTLQEAKILIERWRTHYNQVRPHSALGYRPPAPATLLPVGACSATLRYAPQPPNRQSLTSVTYDSRCYESWGKVIPFLKTNRSYASYVICPFERKFLGNRKILGGGRHLCQGRVLLLPVSRAVSGGCQRREHSASHT